MPRTHWSKNVTNLVIKLEPEERDCVYCGRYRRACDIRHRTLKTLGRQPLHLVSTVARCPDVQCPGHWESVWSSQEDLLAPPYWTITFTLFAWMGHRKYARHWNVPQIRAELKDTYGVEVSADLIEDYTAKYEVMVAARESDLGRLVEEYRDVADLRLVIDGLQPEKGHETLYVVRELGKQRIWFAEPLLSSAAIEVKRLFERTRGMVERVGKPVSCWMSDKQDAFVSGVAEVFPGVPHRYCQNHFMRDVAKETLAQDSHAKVQMRRKVRGLRSIEKSMLAEQAAKTIESSTTTPSEAVVAKEPASSDTKEQVVLDYCAATRGILNDDQGGPLHPPGLRMAEALGEVRQSIGRALADKKGALQSAPSNLSVPV